MTNKPLVAFGDSITVGYGASVPANAYINRLATALGVTVTNYAQTGHMSEDQALQQWGITPSAANETVVMLGTNDAAIYGTDAGKRADSLAFLRDIVVWNACPNRVNARNMTASGSWTNTSVNSIGLRSLVPGSTLTTNVSGVAIYVSFIIQNNVQAEGSFDILVDGVLKPPVHINGTLIGNSQQGANFAPAAVRVGGLAAGSHTVQIVTKDTNAVHFEYVAGSDQSTRPRVIVADVLPRLSSAGLDSVIAAYNADYAAMISELVSDGHTVVPVHFSDFDPAVHLADGPHPNDAGHLIVANDFKNAILGPPPPPPDHTYTPVATYVREDGLYFIGEGSARKQVQTV